MATSTVEQNFSRNLRLLCGTHDSVADVCRRIGISRQQFNKYLSGRHNPSRRNLLRISKHFSIDPLDLFRPPETFRQVFENANIASLRLLNRSDRFGQFWSVLDRLHRDLKQYYGIYDRYHYSSIYVGKIVRSVVCIYELNDCACHSYIERFPSFDVPRRADYVFKYHGMCGLIADRLFFIDFESIQRNEMTFSVMIPRHRNSSQLLFGTTMGIAATLVREPFATRSAMAFREPGKIDIRHLRRAWTLEPNDPSIPAEIRLYLGSEPQIIRGA